MDYKKILEDANIKESILNLFESTYDIDSLLLN